MRFLNVPVSANEPANPEHEDLKGLPGGRRDGGSEEEQP